MNIPHQCKIKLHINFNILSSRNGVFIPKIKFGKIPTDNFVEKFKCKEMEV